MVDNVMEYYGVSEQKACRVLGQCRATQRYESKQMGDEELLSNSITSLSSKYGRYGYKQITTLLNQDSWKFNHRRVYWIGYNESFNGKLRDELLKERSFTL